MLERVNKILDQKPLIYFCREAERAIGLEKKLKNYHICCIENSDMVQQLKNQGISVFCLEELGEHLTSKTSSNLMSHPKVLNWIKNIGPNGFYAQTFLPTRPFEFKVKKYGGELLQPSYELNQKFENKITFQNIAEQIGVNLPQTEVLNINKVNFEYFRNKFGKFVLQFEKSHTGSGTFVIDSMQELINIQQKLAGNNVKVSQFIDGEPYTINGCISSFKVYKGAPQFQITGIKELNAGKGSTVGNEFSYAKNNLDSIKYSKLTNTLEKVGQYMQSIGFRGLFGIDVIITKSDVYLIEINARQTANIPFETKLSLVQGIQNPLSLINLVVLLGLEVDKDINTEIGFLDGAQIFLRSPHNNFEITNSFKSGIYRLQSDNSAKDFENDAVIKDGTIIVDEDADKPLILQNDGYSVEDIQKGGFNIQFQQKGSIKNNLEEICRMQFKESIITDRKIKPWITEALVSIYNQIK